MAMFMGATDTRVAKRDKNWVRGWRYSSNAKGKYYLIWDKTTPYAGWLWGYANDYTTAKIITEQYPVITIRKGKNAKKKYLSYFEEIIQMLKSLG